MAKQLRSDYGRGSGRRSRQMAAVESAEYRKIMAELTKEQIAAIAAERQEKIGKNA